MKTQGIAVLATALALSPHAIQDTAPVPVAPAHFVVTQQKNVQVFGAVGNGIADDTAAINLALVGGGDVYVPAGTYRVTEPLRIDSPTTFSGAGAGVSTIRMATSGPIATIDITSSHTSVRNLTLDGPSTSSVYVGNEVGIKAHGQSSESYLTDLRLENLEISNYGFQGIRLQWVAGAFVSRNFVRRIGYAGVHCYSCTDVLVDHNKVQSISPGTSGNAYGISFTHGGQVPSAANPASRRCVADGNIVVDVPVWKGLDTHDGQSITFSNNMVEGCKYGIGAVSVAGSPTIMKNIVIEGNVISAGAAAHQHYGISVTGMAGGFAENVIVANNLVEGYGIPGNSNAGAIHLHSTAGLSVTDNYIDDFAEIGIQIWHDNTALQCAGNHIDSGFSTLENPAAIRVRGSSNHGFIIANRSNDFGLDPTQPANMTVGHNDM